MIQIIGWMGCFYLVVKACELFSQAIPSGEETNKHKIAAFGGVLSLIGAVMFYFMLGEQSDQLSYSDTTYPYGSPVTREDITADMEAVENAACDPMEAGNC